MAGERIASRGSHLRPVSTRTLELILLFPRTRCRKALGVSIACALAACRAAPSGPSAEPTASAAPAAPSATSLPPLGDAAWHERLALPGFGPASVSVPLGATEPRPVMVALHARNDRPEWACGEWRGITNAYPFILCPYGGPIGSPENAGLVFADTPTTLREIEAGMRALEARFGRYVAPGPTVCAGFSLGAKVGVRLAARAPELFPLLLLGEGGQEQWTPDAIARFAAGGGRRVLFACSTGACEITSTLLLPKLVRAGIDARMMSAGHLGHLVDDRVVSAIRPEFPWLTRGDPRYPGPRDPRADAGGD